MATLLRRLLSGVSRSAGHTPSARPASRDALARGHVDIDVDHDGAPVTSGPIDWLICFVPGLRHQWWHRFANARHKHVFAIRPLQDGTWLIVEPWWTRMMVRVLPLDQAMRYLRWGEAGSLLQATEHIPGAGSQIRGWSNCSVLVAFLLGRSYLTWTPHGLYRRLREDPDCREVSLAEFLGQYARTAGDNYALWHLAPAPLQCEESLHAALLRIGCALMKVLLHPSAIGLYRVHLLESERFPALSSALGRIGPRRIMDELVELSSIITGDEGGALANATGLRFVSMLQGDLFQEAVFIGLDSIDAGRVEAHVRSATNMLLSGLRSCEHGRDLRKSG